MATATVRNLRYDFPSILKHLKHGEEVTITFRGKHIGTLVPAEPKEPKRVQWPDITKRLQAIHGKRTFRVLKSLLKDRESDR